MRSSAWSENIYAGLSSFSNATQAARVWQRYSSCPSFMLDMCLCLITSQTEKFKQSVKAATEEFIQFRSKVVRSPKVNFLQMISSLNSTVLYQGFYVDDNVRLERTWIVYQSAGELGEDRMWTSRPLAWNRIGNLSLHGVLMRRGVPVWVAGHVAVSRHVYSFRGGWDVPDWRNGWRARWQSDGAG